MSARTGSGARPSPTADVTVVVVTWRARELVLRCLAALRSQETDGLRIAVVVVDNDPSDGTSDALEAHHPDVRVVRSARNRGFAGGNNLALRDLASPFVVLVNNDAVPEPGFVAALVRHLRTAPPDVAAVTGRVLLAQRFRRAAPSDPAPGLVHGPDGVWAPDAAGDVVLVNSTGNEIRTDGYGVDRGWLARADLHQPPAEVFGFCGAGVALRTSALDEVGLFDEDFFLYYEDSDLAWRLRLHGYRVEYAEDAVIHHEHATSTGEGSDLFRFHDWRNRLLMLTKDATAPLAARAVLRFALTTASVGLRGTGRPGETRLRMRVVGSYLRLFPRMLRRRRALGKAATVPRAVVEQDLVAPTASRGLRV